MLIHFLYMIKGLSRSITPAFVLGIITPVLSGRETQLELLNHLVPDHLVFIQSQ